MRAIVAVNQVSEIGFRQTTALLIAAFLRSGIDVALVSVDGLSVDTSLAATFGSDSQTGFCLRAATMSARTNCDSRAVQDFAQSSPVLVAGYIHRDDLVIIRTNPGRDPARASIHESFLDICRSASMAGIRVVNEPTNLHFFASKASLAAVDRDRCPATILSSDPVAIAEFVKRSGQDCVIKPQIGSRGHNVIRVAHDAPQIESTIQKTFQGASIVAQHFVRSDHPGDKRVVVLNGRVLEHNGCLGGIERRPAANDFRGNLHAGGSAHQLKLSVAARATADYAAELLMEHGITLAGVDLIEDKIIEFNVFSTGGLFDAERFCKVNFLDRIVAELTLDQPNQKTGPLW